MRIQIITFVTILTSLFASCSKNSEEDNINAPEPIINHDANYGTTSYNIYIGENFTSGKLNHSFPEGTTFEIKSIKNSYGKTSYAFTNEYPVGSWTSALDKATDLTLQSVLNKYKTQSKKGFTIDPTTGALTLLGAATSNILKDTYKVDLIATYKGVSTTLENVVSLLINDQDTKNYVTAKWKYSNESQYTKANLAITKLNGSGLAETSSKIDNFNPNRTYLRIKLADARELGVNLISQVNFTSANNCSKINPWLPITSDGDAIILSSATDRFPVLDSDSLLVGSISKDLLIGNQDINFELTINIKSPGIYDAQIKLSDNANKKALLWPKGKSIYSPKDLANNNFSDNNSQWSHERMRWSENFVVFWEKGFGSDPSKAVKKIDLDAMLANLESSYNYFYNTMKFVNTSTSKVNKYRIQLYINDKDEWLATGAGYDYEIGAMWVNYNAANAASTMSHEVAHTFQYLNRCDGNYAFTGNYNYIGQIWEQSSQYQSSLLYPTSNFSYIPSFIENTHLNLTHETNRYSNFYYLQYWHTLHGVEFLGKIWQQAKEAEDVVDTYLRITGINQATFNDQIYEYAKRTLTWDFIHKTSYTSYINSTSSSYTFKTATVLDPDGYYRVSPTKCVQNYGFNPVKLNLPAAGTEIKVNFEGIKGNTAYNTTHDNKAGWRWGIVAIKSDKTASYSDMKKTDSGELTYTIPENTAAVYLVVTGAPTQHFHHVWDDKASNDEQYPWKAKFTNTKPI